MLINTSFEHPYTPIVNYGSVAFFRAANSHSPGIHGWNTTANDRMIEIWHEGMQAMKAYPGLGTQWVELNANMVSRLYENICLLNGETITWKFYHRGRGSDVRPDVMELNIYDAAGTKKLATLQTASTTNSDWKEYTGSYEVNLPSGSYQLSFEAITTGSGNSTVGNLLDGITIQLNALVEFKYADYASLEDKVDSIPRLVISGTVPPGLSTVTFTVSGTASKGSDFTLTETITINPGEYTPNKSMEIPLTIKKDILTEADENIQVRITGVTNGMKIADANCDGKGLNSCNFMIQNDDKTKEEISDPDKTSTTSLSEKNLHASDTVTLNILFEFGKDVIVKGSDKELQGLYDFMVKNPNAVIELSGHTEKDESWYSAKQKKINHDLSLKRVSKIKKYLTDKGIHSNRIKTSAYGGSRPISSEPAKNRRVVMRVLKI
ncbi:MAG: OmpA family protein [Cytophagaceae bacterium]|nr:OmpA family protein [Cytophagaceae bacterium]